MPSRSEHESGPRRRRGWRPAELGLVAGLGVGLVVGLGGCRGDPAGDPTRDDGPSSGTFGDPPPDTTGEVYVPSEEATDQCALAPSIGAGRHHGTMRGTSSELDGACGLDGPDAFFRLEVPRRSDVWLQAQGVGFSPRVGVLPHTCTTDWTTRTMACTQGVGTWLLDVPAASSLVVSIGIDKEHPALDLPAPSEGDDPLRFVLDVKLRNVLGEGDRCEPPGRGRCGSGTACLVPPPPADDPEAPAGDAVCTVLPGDTCQTAEPVVVEPGGTTVQLDPAALQTDAHAHSCGGARTRERVLRVMLPGPGPHGVVVTTEHPAVGLAVRAPGCLLADERGCAEASGSLAVEVEGSEAFLFVELPPVATDGDTDGGGSTGDGGTGEEAPIAVDIERFEPSPFD